MSLLLDLFLTFARIGLFTFGGAYGAIPLIRDVVLSHGWLDDEMLTYMIAVSESTPGLLLPLSAPGGLLSSGRALLSAGERRISVACLGLLW